MFCAVTPNIAKGDGSIGKLIISENASKINFQKSYKLGHVQNNITCIFNIYINIFYMSCSYKRNMELPFKNK